MSSSFQISCIRRFRRIGHSALLPALALALTLTAVLPQIARAITKINDVRVAGEASGEGAGEAYTAGSGAESVFVLFDYTGASRNTRVAVQIVGSSLELFRQEDRYEGEGTATVEVTGDAIFNSVADSLEDTAAVLLASSNQVQRANISAGQLDNDLNVMIGRVNAGSIAVPMLLTLEDEALRDVVATLDETLARLSEALDDARSTAYDDVAARQSALEGTADDARELEALAEDISDALSDLSGLPLPTMGPQWSYDVSVRVTEGSQQDTPAGDALFYVVEKSGGGADASVGDRSTAVPTRRPLIGEGSRARSTRTPPPAGSAEEPTAAAGSGDDGGDEQNEDKDAGNAAAGTVGVRPSATPRLEASATTSSLDPSASATPAAPGAPTMTAVSGGSEQGAADEADAATGEQTSGEAAAPPTWTPAAGAVAGTDTEQGVIEGENEGGSGPNRAVLFLGLLVLVGAGLWFRSRS